MGSLLLLGFALAGCEEPASPPVTPPTIPPAVPTTPAAPPVAAQEPAEADDGSIPGVTYPSVDPFVTAEQHVYAPRAASLATRRDEPDERLRYEPAVVVSPGPAASRVRVGDGEPYAVPNALLVAVPAEPTAEVGQVVVGKALGRMYVARVTQVEDGGAIRATIYNGNDHREARMVSGEWFRPEGAGSPGTLLHCSEDGRRFKRYTAVHEQDGKRLVVDLFGGLEVFDAERCVALPLDALPDAGDTVRVWATGSVREGTVKSVDAEAGQVVVETQFMDESRERTYQLGEIEPTE